MFAFRGKTLAAAHLSPGQSPASAERPKRRSHLEAISEKIFLRPICDLQIRNVAGRLDSRTSDPLRAKQGPSRWTSGFAEHTFEAFGNGNPAEG